MHSLLRLALSLVGVGLLSVADLSATLPLPTKPANGSTVNTGHSIASGIQRAMLLNEGSGTVTDIVGSSTGTLQNGATWDTDADLGGTCLDTSAGATAGVTFGENGLSYGNGDFTVYFTAKMPAIAARYHVAGETAGAATDGVFWGTNDSGNPQLVVAGIAEVNSTIGVLTAGSIYSIGITYDEGVSVRFYIYNQTTNNLSADTVLTAATPGMNATPSTLGSRRDATISWGECIGVTYIWNRTLLDSEFDSLNTNPYVFINAPSSGGPPLGSLGLLGAGR